ncbi:PP2C family protein-serine/threonine phosphatase [Bdellovibrio bacteriovorus]|uniref:SigmaB regulation protein RsbU n=1 Tax=Bdellovibrio bacteriovorus str. Tiberius TaxID=1069642 RepID=K7ZE86_BDEBC|nr:SpoIIE family protein phosphatase [Bdellovibrio bacteriovorus]AFY00247.1 sigmaB regulation protein RsbU [Bdellovibrio bacteriovorus str. Tiberius]
MAKEQDELKERISELEHELAVKEAELHRYRLELSKANGALEKMIAQISQELKLAQVMQKFLSPTELPNVQGFEFSTKFLPGTRSGGDYFDIFEHEDKLKFGILISSASGYSLSSVLLSVIIKISSQIEARRGLEAHKVLALLAKEVVPSIQNEDKASVFYGIVDRRNFEMQYCSVGNIDGFMQVYGQDSLVELLPTGPSLGKDFNTEPQSRVIQLNPRDRLIMATEGLKLSQNSLGVNWGGHGISEAISRAPKQGVHELRNEILLSNERYSGKQDPVRDQTLIVTEVKDRVIKLASR